MPWESIPEIKREEWHGPLSRGIMEETRILRGRGFLSNPIISTSLSDFQAGLAFSPGSQSRGSENHGYPEGNGPPFLGRQVSVNYRRSPVRD
jgi:hypothetical protein